MDGSFDGKVVWITGASSGIGAALARAFALEGAQLVLSARRGEALSVLASTLPTSCLVVELDLTDEASLPAAAARAAAWKGRIDVLVNNAGISQRAKVLETSMDTARAVMAVNFFGAAALTAAVVPGMVARGEGQVVNITSVATYVAAPLRAYYSASKHALRAWSNTLRAELGGTGVDVTMVCPGYVRTGISRRALGGDGRALGSDDPQVAAGMDPEALAARVLPAIVARQREVYLGGVEIFSIYLERFTPGLVAWVLPDRLPWSDHGLLWHARRVARGVWGLHVPPRLRSRPG